MGVAISGWRLARTVSTSGNLGVVSGTGVASALIAALWKGDPGGHSRRALATFPDQAAVGRIMDRYFREGGTDDPSPHTAFYTLNTSKHHLELTVAANYVEVWLAKEGHDGLIGHNLLEKTPLPNMPSLYGAMLAGVDVIIMGAGIPLQIPSVLSAYVNHEKAKYPLDVEGAEPGEIFHTTFEPKAVFEGVNGWASLKLPAFFPIVTTPVTAMALMKRASGPVDGFIVETPVAGGHNAPPRGTRVLTEEGEPTYSSKDFARPSAFKRFGVPFWMAGGYGTREGLLLAQEEGAQGVQVGTAFAFSSESGFPDEVCADVLKRASTGILEIKTDGRASPTGFPFKIVPMEGSLSDPEVFSKRNRVCDVGYLRGIYKTANGKLGFRCPSEPEKNFLAKGGNPEDLQGRMCLCNALLSTLEIRLAKKNDYREPILITAGDTIANIAAYLPPGATSYSATDVLDVLLGEKRSFNNSKSPSE
jgi:nitronate monooxygenase